uniref:TSC22 domain family protein 2 n=1 Tax=Denticeps clupeoides TaxID=299321 RepID=A0AAY4BA90_9TELE
MSKMPAKKKSCFQITSVTQAQVAASSGADDTESLDDGDESRSEDASAEVLDLSRADFEPEGCDSLSEETSDAHPVNGGVTYRSCASTRTVMAGTVPAQPSSTSSQAQPASTSSPSSSSTVTSCSSRFRVIKLDHGTGEPFRRGRWTCMEFYERDSEGSGSSSKHGVHLDHNADAGAPTPAPVANSESSGESGYVSAEVQQQSYGASHQTLGAVPQSLVPPGHNGVHGASPTLQKSPLVPPSTQAQQFPLMPTAQPDYRTSGTTAQSHPGASLAGPSPLVTPVGIAVHVLGLVSQTSEPTVPGGGALQTSHVVPDAQNGPAPLLGATSGPQTLPNQAQASQPVAAAGVTAPRPGFGQLPAAVQVEESRRTPDSLPQPPVSPGKDAAKPLLPESLTPVDSLFGIPIPADGEEDSDCCPARTFRATFQSLAEWPGLSAVLPSHCRLLLPAPLFTKVFSFNP